MQRHEGVGAEGEVTAEGLPVEGDFEAVAVAFSAYEGDDVVLSTVAQNLQ